MSESVSKLGFSASNLCSQAMRLKKVPKECKHDSSSPQVETMLDCVKAVTSYQQRCLDANIEQWDQALRGCTFSTKFVRLTQEHAQALIAAYKRHEIGEDPHPAAGTSDNLLLTNLEAELQSVIESYDHQGVGVFVKTSCRSAKDAAPALEKFQDVFEQSLDSLKKEQGSEAMMDSIRSTQTIWDIDTNNRIIALMQAGLEMLRYRSATDVLDSMLRSERVMQDMRLALCHNDRFLEHLAVRPWVNIDVDMEFRGFVCNNHLNAVSQYNHLAYFPRLVSMKHELQHRIQQYFYSDIQERLAPLYDRYVVDFAVTGQHHDQIWVIEINPYLETTDACLFSWTLDRSILENGANVGNSGNQAPRSFEFRISEKIERSAAALLSPVWRKACGLADKSPSE
eukprot:m.314218 g.314218  ORF g.314218 m.314218 type:complete len:397 (+) comp20265_c0_seq5:183-1373(+)